MFFNGLENKTKYMANMYEIKVRNECTCEQGQCLAHPGGNILSEIKQNVNDLWPIK